MNLKEIRTALFDQTDWGPTQSVEAIARVNNFINRAYNDICLEAPFLFFESEVKLATQPDAASLLDTDTISVLTGDTDTTSAGGVANAANPWVFRQDVVADTAGCQAWETDRSWDGRMIMIEVTSGGVTTEYRNRIRAVWRTPGGQGRYHLSLEKPWPYQTLGTGPFKYRIYSDDYYLPDDVVEVRSMRLWYQNRNWPLDVMGQQEAEEYSFADSPRVVSHGLPRTVFRRHHFQLQGPAVAPTAELSPMGQPPANPWLGPDPAGTFEYVITYCWGKRDTQFRNPTMGLAFGYADQWLNTNQTVYASSTAPEDVSENRFREPLWESAPSPVSASVTALNTGGQSSASPAIKLTLPNIEYMQGFLATGVTQAAPTNLARENTNQSGWWVRIYRKRTAADFTNYQHLNTITNGMKITGLQKLDLPSAFFLLAEMRIDGTNQGVFYDNGRIIPDYHRRLRETHGYQAVKFYPYPDQRYEVDIRCVRRPRKLVDDQDAPLIHAEAIDLVINKALVLLYENMGNPSMAQMAKVRYDENLMTLSKRYGDLVPPRCLSSDASVGLDRHSASKGQLKRWWTVKT